MMCLKKYISRKLRLTRILYNLKKISYVSETRNKVPNRTKLFSATTENNKQN